MDQLIILFLLLVLISAIVLPVIALVISIVSSRKVTKHIRQSGPNLSPSAAMEIDQLKDRILKLEAALKDLSPPTSRAVDEPSHPLLEQAPQTHGAETVSPKAESGPPIPDPSAAADRDADANRIRQLFPEAAPDALSGPLGRLMDANQLESIIGRRWVGWAAIALILFATAFFLKYAFDNRWIGELGRVAIGITFGLGISVLGFKYHLRGWRVFSQILTAGGIVLLYLSTYSAFGYYHLVNQAVAFVFLAILIGEAACFALIYNAPAIAIMALIGGFLTPLLLHSDRDQYRSLFAYIVALDLGALALLKHWRGLTSLAFFGTHILFWIWYNESYHPRKLGAVLVFQIIVFLIFLLAHLGRHLVRREREPFEDLVLLIINPFVFFATTYHLLNAQHHNWMGVFAVVMGLVYASAAKFLVDRKVTTKAELLTLIAIALTFATIAIPIQLRSNWITIAWAIEALAMLWAGIETRSQKLRNVALTVFGLSLSKLLFWDTPHDFRPLFTPILNRYFLSSLLVVACLFAAAVLYEKLGRRMQVPLPKWRLVIPVVAIVTLWFVISVETQTFFGARAAGQRIAEDISHQRWLGQMALSLVWAIYAAVLAAVGFTRHSQWMRWTSLALFALTIVKAMLIDIAQLEQLYRIIVFFVLGVLLLLVAWGYHRAFHAKESST